MQSEPNAAVRHITRGYAAMNYYLSDFDKAYAIDGQGNEFYVTKKGLVPADSGTVDCMWGCITEEEAAQYAW